MRNKILKPLCDGLVGLALCVNNGKGISKITISERRKPFLCIPADAGIRECRLWSSASVEATLPVDVFDVTLA